MLSFNVQFSAVFIELAARNSAARTDCKRVQAVTVPGIKAPRNTNSIEHGCDRSTSFEIEKKYSDFLFR